MRMRRVPGIVFANSPAGRRAVVAGTCLDVWEVMRPGMPVEGTKSCSGRATLLSEVQLRAALAYYNAYPKDIDLRLHREAQWDPERVRRELPFARPRNS